MLLPMLDDLEDFIRAVSDAAGEEPPKFRRSDLAERLASFLGGARDTSVNFGGHGEYEESLHPRGHGGKWIAADKAHQAAEEELQNHERLLARSATKLEKLQQAHDVAKATLAVARKKAAGKTHSQAALEAHQAELAAVRAKGKLDAHKVAHAEARKAHKAAQSAHGKTGKELVKAQKELAGVSLAVKKKSGKEKAPAAREATKPSVKESRTPLPPMPDFSPPGLTVPKAEYISDDKPIGERLKDYTRGDKLIEAISHLDKASAWIQQEVESSRETINDPQTTPGAKILARERYQRAVKVAGEHSFVAVRDKVHEILGSHIENKVDWKTDVQGTMDSNQQLARYQGIRFLQNMISHGHEGQLQNVTAKVQAIPQGMPQRDRHNDITGIHLSDKTNASTMVHEMGHWMDSHVPGVLAATQAFLKHRVGNEGLTKMKDVAARLYGTDAGYREDEVGRKDHFDRAFPEMDAYYVGKDYGSRATEVLSMGLEKLHKDPLDFARKDPEFFKFILGIADGSLRDHDRDRALDLGDLGGF